MSLLPAAFLFRYSLSALRVDQLPRAKPPLLQLNKDCNQAFPSTIDQPHDWAKFGLAWNPEGFCIQIQVEGKKRLPVCDETALPASDSLKIWIDTRPMQGVHRASRFCHHFIAMPSGGGESEKEAFIKQLPVPRAREDAPEVDDDAFLVESEITKTGYRLSVWLSAEALNGFDPSTQNRLGFYLVVSDRELGQVMLSVDNGFQYDSDPNQWVTVEMVEG